jgi:hypothetical protein
MASHPSLTIHAQVAGDAERLGSLLPAEFCRV